jgi:hypothetical protein
MTSAWLACPQWAKKGLMPPTYRWQGTVGCAVIALDDYGNRDPIVGRWRWPSDIAVAKVKLNPMQGF